MSTLAKHSVHEHHHEAQRPRARLGDSPEQARGYFLRNLKPPLGVCLGDSRERQQPEEWAARDVGARSGAPNCQGSLCRAAAVMPRHAGKSDNQCHESVERICCKAFFIDPYRNLCTSCFVGEKFVRPNGATGLERIRFYGMKNSFLSCQKFVLAASKFRF